MFREILEAAITDVGFEPRLVSDADEVGIIQKRIIQNVYNDPVVVCDVSGKNPNVMFELGMRLAFDRPTIIVKDDKTSYTFDTAPIEHLEYPRDLRFGKIVEFQDYLSNKIEATHKRAQSDKNYTTFLKNFGSFSVAKLETGTINRDDYILDELRALKSLVLRQPRFLEQHEAMAATSDQERSLSRRQYIQNAVLQALDRIGTKKVSGGTRRLVRDEILRSTPHPRRYFSDVGDFDKALDLELKKLALLK